MYYYFIRLYLSVLCMYMCVPLRVCTHVCKCLQRPEDSVRSPEAGVSGSYEWSKVCARNCMQIFWKSNKCFEPLNNLFSPEISIVTDYSHPVRTMDIKIDHTTSGSVHSDQQLRVPPSTQLLRLPSSATITSISGGSTSLDSTDK